MITLIFTLGIKCLKTGLYRFRVDFIVPEVFHNSLAYKVYTDTGDHTQIRLTVIYMYCAIWKIHS